VFEDDRLTSKTSRAWTIQQDMVVLDYSVFQKLSDGDSYESASSICGTGGTLTDETLRDGVVYTSYIWFFNDETTTHVDSFVGIFSDGGDGIFMLPDSNAR